MIDLPLHFEANAILTGSAEDIFAIADEPTLLARDMSRPTLMIGGGSMQCDLDVLAGKANGSVIRLTGKAFGITITAKEIVEDRSAPYRKVSATTGTPQLIVVRDYRMGFEIAEADSVSQFHVWIDYGVPQSGARHCLGQLFGPMFVRWCVENTLYQVQSQHEGSAP